MGRGRGGGPVNLPPQFSQATFCGYVLFPHNPRLQPTTHDTTSTYNPRPTSRGLWGEKTYQDIVYIISLDLY